MSLPVAEWRDSERDRREQLAELEARNLPRGKRLSTTVGMGEVEVRMLRRLATDMQISQARVFKLALAGLYVAHFGRQAPRERG